MSYEHDIETIENDVLTVAVQGWGGGYVIWQRGLTEEVGAREGVYFEFDDQINGGYNKVKECTVTSDAIHVVLTNGERIDFYFAKGFEKFDELKSGLENIYRDQHHVLGFRI